MVCSKKGRTSHIVNYEQKDMEVGGKRVFVADGTGLKYRTCGQSKAAWSITAIIEGSIPALNQILGASDRYLAKSSSTHTLLNTSSAKPIRESLAVIEFP